MYTGVCLQFLCRGQTGMLADVTHGSCQAGQSVSLQGRRSRYALAECCGGVGSAGACAASPAACSGVPLLLACALPTCKLLHLHVFYLDPLPLSAPVPQNPDKYKKK